MPTDIVIREENSTDQDSIFLMNLLAFGQPGEARLVDALRSNPSVFLPELSLVATTGNTLIGHILFTRIRIVNTQGRSVESLALAPMAVLPDYQGKGVGSLLIRTGLKAATRLGFSSVIVLGHERYYPRFGFSEAARWGISAPFDVPSTAFMGIELVKDALKDNPGIVHYPSEFDAVE
jgi:putative acetyltransferase